MITLDEIHPDVAADLINLRDKLTENGDGKLAEEMIQNILAGIEKGRNEASEIEASEKAAETEVIERTTE